MTHLFPGVSRREFLVGSVAAVGMASGGSFASQQGSALIQRRIPSSGESIPVIGLGTSGPFEVGIDTKERDPLSAVLTGFFAAGATMIDTSPMYSSAEAVLGDLLTPDMQSKAFIATKVWTRG